MRDNDDRLETIEAKLNALLRAAIDSQARQAGGGQPIDPHVGGTAERADETAPSVEESGVRAMREARLSPMRLPKRDVADALDEIARLLALSLKRKRDFAEVVAELDAVGIGRARIGALLGASPSRVDAALASFDRRTGKRSKKKRR